ncbi:MAG: phosphate ABC transporter ATP-binding protein, partial [Desulfopila sp.]
MNTDNMTVEKTDAEIEKTRLFDEREAAMPPPIKPSAERDELRARLEDFSFYYADGFQAIKNVDMPILDRKVTAIIGPSGCG